jgi:hypothetical protein
MVFDNFYVNIHYIIYLLFYLLIILVNLLLFVILINLFVYYVIRLFFALPYHILDNLYYYIIEGMLDESDDHMVKKYNILWRILGLKGRLDILNHQHFMYIYDCCIKF